MCELFPELAFELRPVLRELDFALNFARELAVLEADADAAGTFFFPAAEGVSPEPFSAASVPTGGRSEKRQTSESRKRRDIERTPAKPAFFARSDRSSTTVRL